MYLSEMNIKIKNILNHQCWIIALFIGQNYEHEIKLDHKQNNSNSIQYIYLVRKILENIKPSLIIIS
jgi:hypothetical protein